MSRYRNIHCLIWNDDKFPFMSDDAQLVVFHLLTTPYSTPFGLYKASISALADEKRWSKTRYEKAFREAFEKGFVKYDERHLLVFIPNFLKYNQPNNPNVLIGWYKIFLELPDSNLKLEFFYKLKALSEGFGKAFMEAFAKAWGQPLPIQEQEQKQKQKYIPSKNLPPELLELSRIYHHEYHSRFPSLLKSVPQKLIENGATTIQRLVENDKYDLDSEIKPALRFALNDDFWQKQIRSLACLRNKSSRNGDTKFANLLAASLKNGSKPKPKIHPIDEIL